MGQAAAATHPKGVLVQFFSDAFGLEGVFTQKQWLEHLQSRLHQTPVGEHAAIAGDTSVGVYRHQGVDGILWFDFCRPPPLGAVAKQRHGDDGADTDGWAGAALGSGKGWHGLGNLSYRLAA